MRMDPDPDLTWYYQQSSCELGMKASCPSDTYTEGIKQNWPTERQTKAATRQRGIRAALRDLSAQLQSVLECAYETRPIPVQASHEWDLAAPLIERAARHLRGKELEKAVGVAPVLLNAAHQAFRISYGERPRGRRARVNQNVYRWAEAHVDAA